MEVNIADLHCDLLSFLAGDATRTAHDPAVRCSIPQLHAGNVKLQTLAVFTQTGKDALQNGIAQAAIYKILPQLYPQVFTHFESSKYVNSSNKISVLLAFENASSFCDENEQIKQGLDRLQSTIDNIGKPLYISMTWNSENRFGGGASTQIGIKEDGKRLLDFMHQKKIAIDLSHTSDPLAHEIINYIDMHHLQIPMLASHSNSRSITQAPRNLPDDLAKEIFKRKGIIGLNFYRPFVGKEANESFVRHLSHWIEMGGKNQICFGADFFYHDDLPAAHHQDKEPMYFSEYQDASCYGQLLKLFKKELNMTPEMVENMAHKNLFAFLSN
ncbi:MAG: membrane dipeptidase [Parachlamydiaceae bacterium]|nr:membrane dipeptidase [Parachlamydiaceae bacterium]